MKLLVFILVVLCSAVVVGLLAYQDSGYVLIGRGHTTYELSLSLLITLWVSSVIALYIIIRLVLRTLNMPGQLRHWRQQSRTKKARKSSKLGLIELAQGHWRQAERALIKNVRYSDTPLLNYLSAARAAQKQSAPERRDHYLAMAHKSMPDADFAVELTQAELQMAHGQLEQSLATLVHLQSISPKHSHVLYLLARLYTLLKSWGDIKSLIPMLRKHKAMDEKELAELERTVYSELLTQAASNADSLIQTWQEVPRDLKQDASLIEVYAHHLIIADEHDTAENLLRDAIRKQWNVNLVYLYGLARASVPNRQLSHAEAWLKGHENHPVFLLTLGRLCLHNQLWGKARAYLEASIGNGPRPDTYKELGLLMDQLEEKDAAAECFRKGLLLAVETPLDGLPTNVTPFPVTTESDKPLQSLNSKASE